MKLSTTLLATAFLALAACDNAPTSTGSGPVTTQDRQFPAANATGMEVSAPLDLHIRIGDEPSCRFKGPQEILKHLRTEMDGATFRIHTEGKMTWGAQETAEAWVTIPHLRSLHTSGAGEIIVDSRVEEPAVDFDLSGAVNVDLADIQADEFVLDLSGAGNILVRSGQVGKGSYSISGTGNIDAFELKTENAEVSVAGAGRAALTATETLDASISGAGMIRYKGNPEIEKSISGIGRLEGANEL